MYEHRGRLLPGFAGRDHLTRLAYSEQTPDVESAIAREKQIKAWRRSEQVALIESSNPAWDDLSLEWLPDPGRAP